MTVLKDQMEKTASEKAAPDKTPEEEPKASEEGAPKVEEAPKSPPSADLEEALRKEKQKSEEYLKRLMYLQADFENFRKRVEKEMSEMRKFSNEVLLTNLLTVVDELEIALKVAKETDDRDALVKGLEVILKKFQDILAKEGLSKIESLGLQFDPKFHEVICKVPSKEEKEGTVLEEVRCGYIMNGCVIRPSMVKIASSANESNVEEAKKKEV